jgi:hypothetical protein
MKHVSCIENCRHDEVVEFDVTPFNLQVKYWKSLVTKILNTDTSPSFVIINL